MREKQGMRLLFGAAHEAGQRLRGKWTNFRCYLVICDQVQLKDSVVDHVYVAYRDREPRFGGIKE